MRAIITLERAQERGILNSPRENLSRVGLYYNLQRFDRVAELLEEGLANGSIENEQNNWELLAAAYQQIFQEYKAIDAYDRAIEHFPDASGKFHSAITNLYWGMDDKEKALEHLLRRHPPATTRNWNTVTAIARVERSA